MKNKLAIFQLKIFFASAIMLSLSFSSIYPQQTRELTQEDEDAKPQKRTALVIGNADYTIARKLANSSNDATDMAESLRRLGFEVVSGVNLNLKQMNDKVREFGDKLKANGGVGLFYYAGHGIQVSGRNYLIPIDAAIPREDEVDFNALNIDLVLRKMGTANNGLNIVILDACRNNPFARSWSRGDDEGGLAQISAPTGTFIAYATSPDRTASDGTGRNGLYTAELLKVMNQPGMKIEETFKEVRKGVSKSSGGKQIPWDSSSLSGDFYFLKSEQKTVVTKPVETKPVETKSTETPPIETKSVETNLVTSDPKLSKRQPPLKVTQINEISLKTALKPNGKPLLVNFWATWCDPCREEFPDLVKLDAQYKGKIDFITISLDDLAEINRDVPKFLAGMKAEMPTYLLKVADEGAVISSIAKDWQGGLPFTVLYNEKGEIAYFKQGKVKIDEVKSEIDKLLPK